MIANNIHTKRIIKDCYLLTLSIIATVILVKTGAITAIVGESLALGPLGIFITGIFFTSIFTITPSGAVLAICAQHESILTIAVFGAAGAMVGDLIIYLYIKDTIAPDILYIAHKIRNKRFRHFFHLRMWRWLTPLAGAIVIASPLPDELGLAMLGLSKTKLLVFIPLSFTFNFISVITLALAATHL